MRGDAVGVGQHVRKVRPRGEVEVGDPDRPAAATSAGVAAVGSAKVDRPAVVAANHEPGATDAAECEAVSEEADLRVAPGAERGGIVLVCRKPALSEVENAGGDQLGVGPGRELDGGGVPVGAPGPLPDVDPRPQDVS